MKRLLYLISCIMFLAGCTISSPTTTVEAWLIALKNNDQTQVSNQMVTIVNQQLKPLNQEEALQFLNSVNESYGVIDTFTVTTTVPLSDAKLQELGITAGFEVYHSINSQKRGKIDAMVIVVKDGDQWRVIQQNP